MRFVEERSEEDLGRIVIALAEKLSGLKKTQRLLLDTRKPSIFLNHVDTECGAYQIL